VQIVFVGHLVACIWWGLGDAITTYAWFDDVSMVYTPLRFAPFGDQYRYVSTSEGCRGLPPTMR